MKKLIIITALAALAFSSCKKDVTPSSVTTALLARDYLYTIMNQYYLWYNLMPVVVKENYSDPYLLLEAMRYKTLDRWSFVQTYDEFQALYQGSFVGHGIRFGLDPANKVRVVQIYRNSPMYGYGVRRGWIIKKIDETDLAPIFISQNSTAFNNLLGPSQAGVSNTFLFQTPGGKDSIITSIKSSFTLNTVITYDTLHLKSGITGHIVFEQFIPPSNQELADAFAYFQQNNISDLIVDLRYNGGGDMTVLKNMASYLAGASRVGKIFLKTIFNDQNPSESFVDNFPNVGSPLSLAKIVVICTRATASASEDLINGLKPYLDVICIGDTTNGKPVGMVGVNYKTDYMFWPIAFSVVNSSDKGGFYDGFSPEKYVPDDITHDWSDRKELCLNESIYYLEHGAVSAKGTYIHQPSVIYSEKPDRFNNALRIK